MNKKKQKLDKIAVFCGSSFGTDIAFEKNAFLLGETLATKNIELLYGGAKVGLMGAVANGALSKNGKVIGILPEFLAKKELAHPNISELILTKTMQERKTKLHERSDAVITLPGGFGTLEELFEILTWGSLSLHTKPVGLLNVNGYYNDLIEMIAKMVEKDFLKKEYQQMLLVSNSINDLLDKMKNYTPPTLLKWEVVSDKSNHKIK